MAVLLAILGCAAAPLPVVEKLDGRTSVYITHPRTPLIMSPDAHYSDSSAREYIQIGAIEVNRMGSLEYFLWLGIWDYEHVNSDHEYPAGFETVRFIADEEELTLARHSWSHVEIGTSERLYKKIFDEDVDAYYQVTLEQIRMLSSATDLKLRTTSATPKEFVPWYNQERADIDLAEFVTAVTL
ncbi:MAG: hypothetical protein ACR2Q3_02130 [Woeseiaceae bacterium]